jgi:hypothetical protein
VGDKAGSTVGARGALPIVDLRMAGDDGATGSAAVRLLVNDCSPSLQFAEPSFVILPSHESQARDTLAGLLPLFLPFYPY